MNKEKVELALYSVVELTDVEDRKCTGWLVPSENRKEYYILPLNDICSILVFKKSHIKSIKYLSNGVIIK